MQTALAKICEKQELSRGLVNFVWRIAPTTPDTISKFRRDDRSPPFLTESPSFDSSTAGWTLSLLVLQPMFVFVRFFFKFFFFFPCDLNHVVEKRIIAISSLTSRYSVKKNSDTYLSLECLNGANSLVANMIVIYVFFFPRGRAKI